jgi:hypothetical protein
MGTERDWIVEVSLRVRGKLCLFKASLWPFPGNGRSRSMSEIAVFVSWRMHHKDTTIEWEEQQRPNGESILSSHHSRFLACERSH